MAQSLLRIFQKKNEVESIRRACFQLRHEMHIEPSRLLALGVNQQPSTPNFSPNENEARDDVSQQACAKSVPNVSIIDGESRQQCNWLRIPTSTLCQASGSIGQMQMRHSPGVIRHDVSFILLCNDEDFRRVRCGRLFRVAN